MKAPEGCPARNMLRPDLPFSLEGEDARRAVRLTRCRGTALRRDRPHAPNPGTRSSGYRASRATRCRWLFLLPSWERPSQHAALPAFAPERASRLRLAGSGSSGTARVPRAALQIFEGVASPPPRARRLQAIFRIANPMIPVRFMGRCPKGGLSGYNALSRGLRTARAPRLRTCV